MQHVSIIESIVTEFVVQHFVGREIVDVLRVGFAGVIAEKQQTCLAQLGLVEAVLSVAVRTDGEYNLDAGDALVKFLKHLLETRF